MMNQSHIRTELLLGTEALNTLARKHVMIYGIGGVGGYVVEALARAGIGHLTLIDFDTVSESNLNRQICALSSTVGLFKTEVFRQRLLDINPQLHLTIYNQKITEDQLLLEPDCCDYVVDAIDDINAKVALLAKCHELNIPVVASMGAANHLDPTKLRIADISKTEYCPLAKLVRTRLRKQGIHRGICTVFSTEEALPKHELPHLPPTEPGSKSPEGSISYMPAIFGLYCASAVIRDLIKSS